MWQNMRPSVESSISCARNIQKAQKKVGFLYFCLDKLGECAKFEAKELS